MFATDRDLLALEPNVTRDAAWAGQRLVKGVGGIGGTTLTMTSQDVGFDSAGVGAGAIVVVGGTGYEVLERTGATTLTVSRVRASGDDPAIMPSPVSGAGVEVVTYAPQRALVHAQILRTLGVEPGAIAEPGEASEASILNPGALVMLEALGSLHLIFAAAGALAGEGSPVWQRAAMYRERFGAERSRVVVRFDLDGDGLADAARRPGIPPLARV